MSQVGSLHYELARHCSRMNITSEEIGSRFRWRSECVAYLGRACYILPPIDSCFGRGISVDSEVVRYICILVIEVDGDVGSSRNCDIGCVERQTLRD